MHLFLIDMIDIRFKFLEDKIAESKGHIVMDGYQIYSSIYKPFPTVKYTYKTDYVMPDALNCWIGQNNSLQYCINPARTDEDDWRNIGDIYLASIDISGSKNAMLVSLIYNGAIDLYQVTGLIKSWKEKYGNEILEDIIGTNDRLQLYKKDIVKTDNYDTNYRTVGDSDVDFILKKLCTNYTIAGGRPLFYIGLDNVIHYTSVNELLNGKSIGLDSLAESVGLGKNNLPSLKIDLGAREGEVTNAVMDSMMKGLISKDADTIISDTFEIHVGGDKTYKNIKPSLYFSSFTSPNEHQTEKISYLPATDEPKYYPLSKFVYNTIDSTITDIAKNRPNQNIIFEGQNYFKSVENLITIQVTVDNLKEINKLILAGDRVMITTPYAFSMYNGTYIISEIEYFMANNVGQAKITCIRPNLEEAWADKLSLVKDSGKFEYPWTPEVSKTMIYRV